MWPPALAAAAPTWTSWWPSWTPSPPSSTSAWTWPTATRSTLWSLWRGSEKSSPNTPSWWENHRVHVCWCVCVSDPINFFPGWQRSHRGDGGGAHPVWCWHHQSRHRTRCVVTTCISPPWPSETYCTNTSTFCKSAELLHAHTHTYITVYPQYACMYLSIYIYTYM